MMNINNWSEVKKHLHERLLSSEFCNNNFNLLVKVNASADVYRTWYVDLGDKLAPVTYPLLMAWNVSLDDIISAAESNDKGTFSVVNMADVLGIPMCEVPMYIVTNKKGMFGSVGILHPEVQEELNNIFADGYVVLPSSTHEVIVTSGDMNPHDMASMVHSINRSVVNEADRLSDHVFRIEDSKLSVLV